MTVNANTPCRFAEGLDHGCKTFEFTNIARSMRTRTFCDDLLFLPSPHFPPDLL